MDRKPHNNSIVKAVFACFALFVLAILMRNNPVQAAAKPDNPKFSVKAGTYYVYSYKSVKLSCGTENATIYYSTDGENYSEYTKAIKLKKSSTIYAYSMLNGVKSDIVSRKYKLKVRFSSVTPKAGEYDESQTVIISTKATKVTIYYTLDGTKPTAKSSKYTSEGILLNKTSTLRLLVKKSGFTNRYKTYEYVIEADNTSNAEDNNNDTLEGNNTETGTNEAVICDSDKVSGCVFADGCDIYGKKLADRVYYSMLNSSEKKAYELIYRACVHHDDKVNISAAGISSKNSFKIFQYVISESPELFWVNDGNISSEGEPVINLFLYYTNSVDEENSRFKELEETAVKVIQEAQKTDSLYDFVMYLHDWIVDKAEYNNSNSQKRLLAGTDDIILDGKGLCTAYARAFMYLCHKADIDCVMVSGRGDNGMGVEEHSWNLVKLDGKWYAMDVTWDDPLYAPGTAVTDVMKTYAYFCLSDAEIGLDHTLNKEFVFESLACNSDEYSYAVHNNIAKFDNVDKAFEYLSENVEADYLAGKLRTEVSCADANMALTLYDMLLYKRLNTYRGYSFSVQGKYVYVELVD